MWGSEFTTKKRYPTGPGGKQKWYYWLGVKELARCVGAACTARIARRQLRGAILDAIGSLERGNWLPGAGRGLKFGVARLVASVGPSLDARLLVDWAAVDREVARVRLAHAPSARRAAAASMGFETRAAWREALGRLVRAAADRALSHASLQVGGVSQKGNRLRG